MPALTRPASRAFTLTELLLVIGVIALLIGFLFPALTAARRAAGRTACLSNERQIGAALVAYSADFEGAIAYGPKAPPTTPSSFYPGTGDVTSLLSLQSGAPVALGLLLRHHLANVPRVLFCPGADQIENAQAELAKVGFTQAQCDYYYRHGSSVSFSDNVLPPDSSHIRLAGLGLNRNARPIRALVMDENFIASPSWAAFGVLTRTSHARRTVNVLYSDGHADVIDNSDARFTINPQPLPEAALDLILKAFEAADQL